MRSVVPTREDVQNFLDLFRLTIEYRLCHFRPRPRLDQDLRDLQLSRQSALAIISSLTPMHYSAGPAPDDTDATKEVWIFGYNYEDDAIYIKLRIEPAQHNQLPYSAIWSFHRAKYPMRYPFQGDA